ncbi:MAG: toxin-antitoxin system HicB family antitoxin [Candidatus Gracilibacteria bacterium]
MKEYKKYNYNYLVKRLGTGKDIGFKAIIPKFPNMHVYADTIEELDEMVMLTIEEYMKSCKKYGHKIPEEDYTGEKINKKPKGKIPLRINPELHTRVELLAQASELSVNRFIEKTLEEKVGFQALPK